MDPDLKYGILGYIENGKVPETVSKQVKRLVEKVADHYIIHKNKLYRIINQQDPIGERQEPEYRRVIDKYEKIPLLRQTHDQPHGGHLGQENTYQKIADKCYWPGMKQDIITYVRTCKKCQKRELRRGEAPLEPIKKKTHPFYHVGIDVMGPLPQTLTGKRYIVAAVDHFTKWIEAEAVESNDAQTIVHFIHKNIITNHGVPVILTSDRGTEFVNEIVTALTNTYHIKHIRTTAYHPQGNGQVERINRYLKNILSKNVPKGADWSHYLPSALFTTRVTRSATTKFSPSELLYGYQIRQPFESDDFDPEDLTPEEYASREFSRVQQVRQQAGKFILKAQARQKAAHDDRVQLLEPLHIGDLVLLYRNIVEANWSAKLEPRWEGPYRIFRIKGTTYQLKTRQNNLLPNHFHRNRLKKYHDRTVQPRPYIEVPTGRSPQ